MTREPPHLREMYAIVLTHICLFLSGRVFRNDGYWGRSVSVVCLSATPHALCLNSTFYAKSVWEVNREKI
jgi:hypothetical protein